MAFNSFPIETVRIQDIPTGSADGNSYIIFNDGTVDRKITIGNFVDFIQTILPDDSTLPTVVSSDGVLETRKTYYLNGDYNMTLQNPVGLTQGAYLTITKKRGVFPTITVDGTLSEVIQTDNGDDTSISYDIDRVLRIQWDGNHWNVME